MKLLTLDEFTVLLGDAPLKPKLKRELRFVASTRQLSPVDWSERELLAITDRTGNAGVLLIAPDDQLFIIAYELSRGLISNQTGRSSPVICDFCRTWQSGTNAGSIHFTRGRQAINSTGFLCCVDLACSSHVRGKTMASRLSRAQLREDMTSDQRIERLQARLRQLVIDMQL